MHVNQDPVYEEILKKTACTVEQYEGDLKAKMYIPIAPYVDDQIQSKKLYRPSKNKYTICIVSDFSFPRLGMCVINMYK